ncbi:MAG TPA: long-chain fatty acid--CoA ligase [Longimicrobiaceae bacterium]|jgi:long-chain acyl-CoA synthetase|nr:long-chain fatty acid--CoA ligase [Longimicrobiaceae bacterium]
MATASQTLKQSRLVPLRPVERDTIPKIFLGGVDRFRRPDALAYKTGGEWKPIAHREVEERVTRLAAALAASGIVAGDRVAILSENRPEWAITDYAVTGMGAIDVPIYPTLPANQIAYILNDCGAKAVFVSNRTQLAKIAEIRGELPALEQVIAFEDPGSLPGAQKFADVLEGGRRAMDEGRAGSFRERAQQVQRDDVATLIYTSGTTGNPKGVMLTHWNLASNVAASQQHDVLTPEKGDVALSFLPLSHVYERMVSYWYWDTGIGIAYAESFDKVVDNFGEVRPSVAVSVPRLFEKIYSRVTGSPGLKGKIAHWAVRVGGRVVDERVAGRTPAGALAMQYKLADKLVFSKLRERTGGKMRVFISGGAPLSPDIAKFFFAAGLPVYEGYGLTETSPVIAVNGAKAWRLGTVGLPIPGAEVRIGDDGEILSRGPNIMKGYWKNDAATAETIDADGWFHTGDVGELDGDGYLRITDRIKNLIVTAGGKNIAPQPMENLVALSPYVAQVVMMGDRRAFPSMLIVPDFEALLPWAAAQGIATTDRAELAADPRVNALLEKEALSRLGEFARYELPKKIAVIPEEFSIDAGTLTPKLSIRRKAVEAQYKDLIEGMYEGHSVERD